uniref:Probable G-protein coupled receptor Mth-like 10 n=1 Tax=Drosophila melanogaster TaxID=7227 RepID=MTH10_DROME|nr:methuselah-like 10, isoform B [Drosophila melanogaster]Q9W0R5.3 RecName: Full=Probable G-protein coupled receptor Mth-like 10; AltName: Full=Protein methuselah-like 10; Flags: Precursor [Drosophila melanogaster]AAO41210.2 methuselah-like 10, isoform B [Drosophila melanogaster]|eukprot:NP_788446.2 methuselah-like 10, isoform B [Drosophila melanogaster]
MPKKIHQPGGSLYCGVTLLGVLCLVVFRLIPGIPFGTYVMAERDHYHTIDDPNVPCNFYDTVNLTGHRLFPNGSYDYYGTIVPAELVGTYDYIHSSLTERIEVREHVRGCVCKFKSCLNICCPWRQVFNSEVDGCIIDHSDNRTWPDPPMLNITFRNESTILVNMFTQFAIQSFRPCPKMFSLQPETNNWDDYLLFENGSMLRVDDKLLIRKNEFCMVPTYVNESDMFYTIHPANCDMQDDHSTVKIINSYAMMFSIPFMMLTIAVYLLIPELRNQHGKSLVCYLIGLSVGYSSLCYVQLYQVDATGVTCKVFGYTAYFFFMGAYMWLSVISFDLWHNFRGTRGINRFQEKKRFLFYSLYSWGIALVFLAFTYCAQQLTNLPANLKPGIGDGVYCWLDMSNWAAMIYFYGPILAIVVANTIMFIMTAIKIHGVQREMARIIASENSTKNLRTEKDKRFYRAWSNYRFGLFLRLFLIMGITWLTELISYFVGSDKGWSKLFYISDLANAMQGFLIFMLFVMKKKVKHLITNRCSSVRDGSNQRQSQYSTKTTSSSVANLSLHEKPSVEKPLVISSSVDPQKTTIFR